MSNELIWLCIYTLENGKNSENLQINSRQNNLIDHNILDYIYGYEIGFLINKLKSAIFKKYVSILASNKYETYLVTFVKNINYFKRYGLQSY